MSIHAGAFEQILLLFLFISFNPVQALIPEVCVRNATQPFGACCPLDPFNHQVCGGPMRGSCQEVIIRNEYIPHVFRIDDRTRWPLRFFSFVCHCKGNYFGLACESCWFGWIGPNCDQREMKIRRDIRSLNENELNIFKGVVERSRKWPSGFAILDESTNWRSDPLRDPIFIPASVQYFATFIHRYGARTTLYKDRRDCDLYGFLNFNHDGVVFPTWHRYFQLIWEQMLSKIALQVFGVHGFTIPYWDFVGMTSCDICNDRYIGGKGVTDKDGLHISKGSIFSQFQDHCLEPPGENVCFGCQAAGRLPTITRKFLTSQFPNQRDVNFVLNLRRYHVPGGRDTNVCNAFHMALEGYCGPPGTNATFTWMHNKLHRMIEGSMCCLSTATNDPMFMLVHNTIDKMFNIWLRLHRPRETEFPNHNVRPGHYRDSFMIGLLPLVRNGQMFLDSLELGYNYDDMLMGKYAQNGLPPLELNP